MENSEWVHILKERFSSPFLSIESARIAMYSDSRYDFGVLFDHMIARMQERSLLVPQSCIEVRITPLVFDLWSAIPLPRPKTALVSIDFRYEFVCQDKRGKKFTVVPPRWDVSTRNKR